MDETKLPKSCLECDEFTTLCSSFYDDEFIDFVCSGASRTITRITSSKVPDVPIPKWCPKRNPVQIKLEDEDD